MADDPELPEALPRRRGSLTTRYLVIVIVAELVFGAALATLVSGYSLQQAAQEHRSSRGVLTDALAASFLGEIRGRIDPERLKVAVDSVTHSGVGMDIIGIEVRDADDAVVYRTGAWPVDAVRDSQRMALEELTQASIVSRPIIDGEAKVGSVSVVYQPIGVAPVIAFPLIIITSLVVAAIMFSTAWATWVMSRTVAVPIARLRDSAGVIAEGGRNVPLPVERDDELGELARAIDRMMTQLHSREKELTDSYESLERAYKRQARLKDELVAALRTRSDFFAVASHEIRSPLAVVRMYAELLDEGELGGLNTAQEDAVGSISSASARLTSIVADLMDVALLDRGLMPLTFGTVGLDALVADAVADAAALGRAQRVAVVMGAGDTGLTVRGDELRIRQILDNLLSNAIKYSDPVAPVTVRTLGRSDHAEVHVIDRGPGVPAEKRHLLFELFRRVETGDNAIASGLGLGLAISQRIAEAHGGSIEVRDNDEDGHGTVFVLILPYDGAGSAEDTARISVV